VTVTARPAMLRVADQGPGIPPHELPHAFERFRLRGRYGRGSPDGAGLGLAIVRELTEAMGGSIAVENLNGGGAMFTVRLPL
jgi:signal transduction histidine kinase